MELRCALALVFVAGTWTTGCSGRKDPAPWIDEDAAVVHCTTAGRTRMPPVLLGLPFPPPPTGLYARGMDPMALGDMGYERDRPVCAGLLPHDDSEIRTAAVELASLSALVQRTSQSAVRAVSCPCETARALGVRELVVACAEIPAKTCSTSEEREAELSALLSPLAQAIEATAIPRRHWRLVGPTDRPGWLAERLQQLLARHVGGSTVYLPGQAVPARDNYVLLRALLEHPNVVAIARQDGGRAVMVARVIDGMQILDHFELPPLLSRLSPIRAYLDNARPSDVLEALDKPARGYVAGVSAADGNFIELDVENLERIDAMTVAASVLRGEVYDEDREEREEPPLFVDRVAVQAPFGQDGRTVVVRAALSPRGTTWAAGLPDDQLGANLGLLGLSGQRPAFVSAQTPAPAFLLRGTETNAVLVHGLHAIADAMQALELFRPGAVEGKTRAWEFALPQGSLAQGVSMQVPASLRGLGEQVKQQDYRVTATVDPDKATIVAKIVPD